MQSGLAPAVELLDSADSVLEYGVVDTATEASRMFGAARPSPLDLENRPAVDIGQGRQDPTELLQIGLPVRLVNEPGPGSTPGSTDRGTARRRTSHRYIGDRRSRRRCRP